MFKTALAQMRFMLSMGFGIRFSVWAFDHLIDSIIDTKREFGTVADEGLDVLAGPSPEEGVRRELQLGRFRAQATHAARETAYYERLFSKLDVDPRKLGFEDIARVPLTPKEALREDPDAFVRRTASACYRTTTTGTTGKPTSVCFSEYEMRTYIALNAIALLSTGRIDESDIVQISSSSRATLGNVCLAGACARVGALVNPIGLIEPVHTLALLAEKRRTPGKKSRVSYMNTYPSYLGELVEEGLRRGYRHSDFGLERINIGGELCSEGLKARARRLFGNVEFDEGYSMTETWPLAGQPCSEGHLHYDPSSMVEVLDPESGAPSLPGAAGTIVATPLPPYRETTLLLRYDTQDVVRPVEGELTCELKSLQATSHLLGKLRLAVRHDGGWTFPRDVLEALEGCDAVPLPARFGFWAVPGGVAVEAVARGSGPDSRRAIEANLEERGVPVRELRVVEYRDALRRPVPLRCDLKEALFEAPDAQQVTAR